MRIYSLQEAQEEKDLETSRIWVGNNRLSKKGNEHIVFQHKCHSNINIFLSNWHFFFKPYSAVGKLIRSNHILCSKNSCILLRTLVACGQKIRLYLSISFAFSIAFNKGFYAECNLSYWGYHWLNILIMASNANYFYFVLFLCMSCYNNPCNSTSENL